MDSLHSLTRQQLIENRPLRDRSAEVSACEPFTVFAMKSLLHPTIPVLTLLLCLMVWDEPLRGPYFLMAVATFLGVAELIEVMPARSLPVGAMAIRSLVDITLRWVLLMAFIWLVFKLSGVGILMNKPMLWTWTLTAPLALWAGELLAQRALDHFGATTRRTRKAVIIGATGRGLQLAKALADAPALQVETVGYFEDRDSSRIPRECAPRVLGRLSDAVEFIRRNHTDIVYVSLPMAPQPRIVNLLNSLHDSTVSIYFVPDFTAFDLVQPRFDMVEGIPVIAVRDSPFYGLRAAAKRLGDIIIAGLALVALAPVLIAVAIGVKMSSPGPVLYRQKRYGLDGREIVIYKFRSLSVVEDGVHNYTQVVQNDKRLTPFGAFIRRTSLDELPQLLNILQGNMSIVGPRPHAVAVNEAYRQLIPGYMVRHKIKPGITGWAQVNGYRGGDDLESMRLRIAYDLEYLRHWSLGLDVTIMLKTAMMIWNDRNAY